MPCVYFTNMHIHVYTYTYIYIYIYMHVHFEPWCSKRGLHGQSLRKEVDTSLADMETICLMTSEYRTNRDRPHTRNGIANSLDPARRVTAENEGAVARISGRVGTAVDICNWDLCTPSLRRFANPGAPNSPKEVLFNYVL